MFREVRKAKRHPHPLCPQKCSFGLHKNGKHTETHSQVCITPGCWIYHCSFCYHLQTLPGFNLGLAAAVVTLHSSRMDSELKDEVRNTDLLLLLPLWSFPLYAAAWLAMLPCALLLLLLQGTGWWEPSCGHSRIDGGGTGGKTFREWLLSPPRGWEGLKEGSSHMELKLKQGQLAVSSQCWPPAI